MLLHQHLPESIGVKWTRFLLGGLLLLLAINAFGGGYYGMAGAEGVPLSWLEGSPFANYFIPSLVLFVVVGGGALWAAVAVFAKHPAGRTLALACSAVVAVWLGVQVAIIGYVSWMQPATATAALLMLLLALRLPRRGMGQS